MLPQSMQPFELMSPSIAKKLMSVWKQRWRELTKSMGLWMPGRKAMHRRERDYTKDDSRWFDWLLDGLSWLLILFR